ncbi:MAG: ATP-binding protein [Acidobacteria bacterium]|nr:ATP-binding protein [Acidobacteriota bacterium]
MKKILIVDDHDDLASLLKHEFSRHGHIVRTIESRAEAVGLIDAEEFDLVISDLDNEQLPLEKKADEPECIPVAVRSPHTRIKAFKLCFSNYEKDEIDEDELKYFVRTTLDCKARCVDRREYVQAIQEKIEFEVPSVIGLMNNILEYLMKRVEKVGVVNPETSNLFVALDEAFVNAVKHGNKYDPTKLVRITADVSPEEARFTIEDEGDGFDVAEIPDPLDPQNLFKTSGRGVLFIYNIMDEVKYNERGNRLTMVKKRRDDN